MSRRTLALLALLVLVLALSAVAGCGGTDDTTTTAPATSDTTAPATSDTTAPATSDTTAAAAPTGDPIVVGAIVSATGPAAPLGEPERAALLMAEEQVNAAGGVLGRPLKIVIEDDQSNPKEAVTAANKLLTQEKVIAIIGSSSSGATLAMKPITDKAGIPLLAIAASNAITADPIAWVWRAPPKDSLAVGKALSYMEAKGYKTIGLLYDDNAYGSSGAAEIEKVQADYGLEVVAKESYKTTDTDLTAQLTKIKGANPDVLLVWGTNPGPAVAAKNAQQLGMTMPFMGSHGIANQAFIDLAGDAAEGVIFPAGPLLVPSAVTDPKQKEVVDKFVADYEAATGKKPPTFAGHAYGALTLLMTAIEAAKGTDPAALQTQLSAIDGVVTPDGTYHYSATDHDGLALTDLIMVKIQGGTWVEEK